MHLNILEHRQANTAIASIARGVHSTRDDSDLLAIQYLLGPSSVISMLKVDKGIHTAREGDHIVHWAVYFKHSLQHSPWQPGVQVAQPQMLAGTCEHPLSCCRTEEGEARELSPTIAPALVRCT